MCVLYYYYPSLVFCEPCASKLIFLKNLIRIWFTQAAFLLMSDGLKRHFAYIAVIEDFFPIKLQ